MKGSTKSALLGAAFLMATSAIGPGFITQTTVFTQQLLTSFGFVILVSIILDIAAQLNVWRIIAVTEMRAQDLANNLLPGMGYVLAILIVAGGLVFNIGNVAGAGLGMNVIYPFDTDPGRPVMGAAISAAIALLIFWIKEAGVAMDWFAKILGFIMIALTLYVAISSQPPVGEAIYRSFVPVSIDTTAIVTLVGGTVGGYISFAGAHRLLDAGIKGEQQLPQVTRSSVSAILLASLMRILLFMAALGVVTHGGVLNSKNPAASVFQIAAGDAGYKIFGIVLWSAAITSVVGSAYTSISFLRTLHPVFDKYQRLITTLFILISMGIFAFLRQGAVQWLVVAGALNGLILPLSLALLLAAVFKKKLMGDYKHPVWLAVAGWIVVVIMSIMGATAILSLTLNA
ncbi:NRAMP family divalent metal transporter [Longitalea arenae]|uniref:NRAMP family divalent metal transporter n=1 Tax=Longitalea arenae TaxID=2812558 RepID=UPI00196851F6|nr:NRAMP family divalent metal transporter [Longitalea arenae]